DARLLVGLRAAPVPSRAPLQRAARDDAAAVPPDVLRRARGSSPPQRARLARARYCPAGAHAETSPAPPPPPSRDRRVVSSGSARVAGGRHGTAAPPVRRDPRR